MKATRNLYKKDITRGYEGDANIVLTKNMKQCGYRTGVYVTPNQMEGRGYRFGVLDVKQGEKPITINKYDFRTDNMHTVTLYNIEQTTFPEQYPGLFQHMKDEYAETYNEMHRGFSIRRLAAFL